MAATLRVLLSLLCTSVLILTLAVIHKLGFTCLTSPCPTRLPSILLVFSSSHSSSNPPSNPSSNTTSSSSSHFPSHSPPRSPLRSPSHSSRTSLPSRIYKPVKLGDEIGDCVNNGDSDMKKLSRNCGCAPQPAGGSPVERMMHPCCRPHLHKLLSGVFKEATALNLPLVLTGGAVIGWKRNGKLVPYDLDLDASLEERYWNTPKYYEMMHRLADSGFCVWFRRRTLTKVWSSVFGFDISRWRDMNGMIYWSGRSHYKSSDIYPVKNVVLDGVNVSIPNKPVNYLNKLYGAGRWEKPLKCTGVYDRKCYA